MRFHIGVSLRPKQIIGFIGVIGAIIGGLIAGGVIPV